jgi:sulfonate dioxygenase
LKGEGTKQPPAKYPNYLPVWDNEKEVSVTLLSGPQLCTDEYSYPPLKPYEHYEHGKDADPTFPNLLNGAEVADLTANIGAEVRGVQLTKLSDKGKDELALFVAQKKVVGKFGAKDSTYILAC